MENFWQGFEKQAGLAGMAAKATKSLGSTLTGLGAKGAGKAVTGFAPKVGRTVGKVTNTVNSMSTAGKLGLGAVGGATAGYMASSGQSKQPQY